jgi:hypothetical protein
VTIADTLRAISESALAPKKSGIAIGIGWKLPSVICSRT